MSDINECAGGSKSACSTGYSNGEHSPRLKPHSVGISLEALEEAGVQWEIVFQPLFDLMAAPEGSVIFCNIEFIHRLLPPWYYHPIPWIQRSRVCSDLLYRSGMDV